MMYQEIIQVILLLCIMISFSFVSKYEPNICKMPKLYYEKM